VVAGGLGSERSWDDLTHESHLATANGMPPRPGRSFGDEIRELGPSGFACIPPGAAADRPLTREKIGEIASRHDFELA
jgi:hypothetical protein